MRENRGTENGQNSGDDNKMVSEQRPVNKKKKYLQEIRLFFVRLIALGVFLWVFFGVIFGLQPMNNNDMVPRLNYGDLLLYFRLEKQLHVSDVVVYRKDGDPHIGRIVAVAPDVVEVTDRSTLVINGNQVMESEIYYDTPRYDSSVKYPLTIGEQEYFILGDFREGATDSRYFGAVSRDEIKGRVIACLRRDGI